MNTLKPLLIVAVLAGVGYGVYIRLNSGNNAPPPPVADGWDSTPSVQLPDQPSATPWSPSATAAPGPPGPVGPSATAAAPPGAVDNAPPYRPPSAAEFSGAAPPASTAPLAGQSFPESQAPPYANDAVPPPSASLPGPAPPQPSASQPPLPNSNPYALPGEAGTSAQVPGVAQSPPPVDPYADPQEANAAAPYRAPPAGAAPPSSATPAADVAVGDFGAALDVAKRELEGGQMASALRQLSKWCDHPQLSPQDQQQLNQLLDQVAGTVVYSTQHLLEPPYEVQPGERLEDIGEKYGVPWQLLAKINGIDDPSTLRPGERLKVVRGPFHAVVSLQKRELMLLTADGSYAGRFRVGIGAEHPPQEGTFPVAEKVANPVYYGRDRAISAEDAENPLGERWIGLGNKVGIHGTNNPQNIGRADLPGSISLNEADVEDVYDILSLGSRVIIRR